MAQRILGLDLGTNSIGWAVVDKEEKSFELVDKGVRIFQEGVKIEKGAESSKAAERNEHRSARRIKYRRKLRKIETLKVLSENGYCPQLTEEELNLWRYKKVYPQNEAFKNWYLTDNVGNEKERKTQTKNPYYFRNLVATQKIDLSSEENRFAIGRAFYHLAQRRGFLSNRLEGTKESDGVVKEEIHEISKAKGERTLGQYFYELFTKGEKIRDRYTHREEHYYEEFERICTLQAIPEKVKNGLDKAIFYQRPLRSQKGLIGNCVFETNKPRCAVSRPEFEEYRMLCFINNIKIKTPSDEKMRALTETEKNKIMPQFFRKSKEYFDFEDLAKQIAPKKQYKYFKDRNINAEDWLLNFSMNTTVSGCPVSARFKELFGTNFISDTYKYKKNIDGRTPKLIVDAWHALYCFDSDDKLHDFAKTKLGLDEDKVNSFLKIRLKKDFASLSLKAINKILPYLREGLIYSHAVFMANMEEALPENVWKDEQNRKIVRSEIKEIIENQNEDKAIAQIVNGFIANARRDNVVWSEQARNILSKELERKVVSFFGTKRFYGFSQLKKDRIINNAQNLLEQNMSKDYGKGVYIKSMRIDEAVINFLEDNFGQINRAKIYHPSAIEIYKPAKRGKDGNLYLGSPMTTSVRNPMAMRALHQLRKVINQLILEGIIDQNTKINIEMSRGLLNANERAGLKNWQNTREKKRKEYISKIKEFYSPDYEPSNAEVLKYQLWEEQKHICLYTGNPINIEDFLGSNPKYDIEHTIPRSLSYDNSQANKTLCDNYFNRGIKKNKIPSELPNHDEILERIESWKKKVEDLETQIERAVRQARAAVDKKAKDNAIKKRHFLNFERNYWKDKLKRFTMEEVPEGFKNSQMVDIGIITKYSRLYLKTVFEKVYTVKGSTVADFRKMWGLQKQYSKKARINHIHHCIDAITIACMDKGSYESLAKFYHDSEDAFVRGNDAKPLVAKPWVTFTEDVLGIENQILVSHYTVDNLPKFNKKVLRKRGKKILNKKGNFIYQTGDSVRGILHKDTFYGAIANDKFGNIKKDANNNVIPNYVVRKSIEDIKKTEVDKIVDKAVKEKVQQAVKEKVLIFATTDTGKNKIDGNIWMNKNKNITIKKVRIYQTQVKNPLPIKEQRDKSLKHRYPYKEKYRAVNGGNYLMAIYEQKDDKGKWHRDFEIRNNIECAEYFKTSVQTILRSQNFTEYEGLIPKTKTQKKIELPLKAIIKVGMMVILWEESPEEVWDLPLADIRKRMYKIVGMSTNRIKSGSKYYEFGNIVLRFHQEASSASDLKTQDGQFKVGEVYIAQRKLSHNQFNALIEGVDFKISPLGKISKI